MSALDRLNSVRSRLDALGKSKAAAEVLPKRKIPVDRSTEVGNAAKSNDQLTNEPGISGLQETIAAASYANAAAPITRTGKSYGANDKAFRQMNIYFDYSSYANECATGKPKTKLKLTKAQVESLKKQKKEKKLQKMREWLYND